MNTCSTLSLIVPCYNEEKTLRNCVERIQAIQTESLKVQIIIVDDCSKDKSLEIAREISSKYSNIKLVMHSVNQGKGAALRTGFLEATGDFVGIQDADEEYDPQQYHIMLQPMLENKADVVFGSRYLRPDARRVLYFWHTWMNKSLTLITNMFTNLDITDMETCYKLFRREVIQEIAPQLQENRFGFEPEVTVLVSRGNYNVYECAISYNPRTYEEGKKIGWKDGVRALYCIVHYGGSFAPMPMQILLYLVIGTLSAIINIVSFGLLVKNNIPISFSIMTSFVIAAVVNYFLCISILFKHKARWDTKSEIAMYIVAIFFMGAFDLAFTTGLLSVGFTIFTSKVLATGFGLLGNFLFRRYLVF